MMNEQAQGQFVHPVAFGEGERFSYETAQALAQSAVPTLDIAGFARALAGAAVGAAGKDFAVRQPEVAARGAAAIGCRDALTQGTSRVGRTVTNEIGDDLARLAAQRDPNPAGVGLGTGKAPKFVQLQHVARLGRQKRVA